MVHGKNRTPYRIDRRLTGLAAPDYDATFSFGLPFEPVDCQYGKSRLHCLTCTERLHTVDRASLPRYPASIRCLFMTSSLK